MKEKACRMCKKLFEEGKNCPACNSTDTTTFWSGYVVFINSQKSEIAQKMGIEGKGKYALRISR